MRYKTEKRRGAITVVVALCLTVIIGVVAIALEGGMVQDNRRYVQSAADAAALAAADDLFSNWGSNSGQDTGGTAKTSALSTASANGYNNDGVTNVVTVNIPPQSGNFKGKAGYVEVIIKYYQKRHFSSILGSGDVPVTARAVAYGNPGNTGILILNPTLQGACEIDGIVNIQNNGQIFSNSNNTVANDSASNFASGSIYVGPNGSVTSGGLYVYKNLVNNGTVTYTNGGSLNTFTSAVTDPLGTIPEPTTSGLTTYSDQTITTNTTLQPGIYTNITIGSTGGWSGGGSGGGASSPTVTLAPGIYYLNSGGSFTLNAGSIQGTGVMIFNNTGADNVFGMSNPAGGTINLTPPTPSTGGTWPTGTTSSTYNGISYWVPRSSTSEYHLESSYNVTMTGTFYSAGGEFDFRPDGSSTVFNTGNYICAEAEWGQGFSNSSNLSNGTININPGTSAPTQRPVLVE
jgi:hypothetical protein